MGEYMLHFTIFFESTFQIAGNYRNIGINVEDTSDFLEHRIRNEGHFFYFPITGQMNSLMATRQNLAPGMRP